MTTIPETGSAEPTQHEKVHLWMKCNRFDGCCFGACQLLFIVGLPSLLALVARKWGAFSLRFPVLLVPCLVPGLWSPCHLPALMLPAQRCENAGGLNTDFTGPEIAVGLKAMQNNKSVGLEGIQAEYYKSAMRECEGQRLLDVLAPYLTSPFNRVSGTE